LDHSLREAQIYFEDHRQSDDLSRLALRGGIVSVAIKYGSGALQIISAVVLARLLAPEDFGLVAIVAVLTGFAPMLIDFGLGDAIAQRNRITPSQVSTLFWVSSGLGVIVAVGVALCSPLIAWLYGEPRLELIMMLSAVSFALSGISNQHLALLKRTMQFGRIGKIQFLSTFISIVVSVSAAAFGLGYWALVLRPITSAFCVAIGAWHVCRWRPSMPALDSEVKSMIRFGMQVVGFTVAYMVTRAVDRIALGLFYSVDQVGYYQNAMNLYDNSISATIEQTHNVGSAALAKLQSNPEALRKKFEAALSMLCFFLMPASAILSVTAEDLTVILLGEKWHAAGSLLSILALRGIFHSIEGAQGWVHLSIGRADRWRNWGIVSLIVQIAAVLCGLPFGAKGVATAVVCASAVISVPSIVYAGRPIGLDAVAVLRAAGPQLVGSVLVVAVGWWLQLTFLGSLPSYQRIVISGCFCGGMYLAVVVGLFRLTEPIKVAGRIFRDLAGKLSTRVARG
jgi:polysaccharide transporter, PST family